jgi:hypothetical protein
MLAYEPPPVMRSVRAFHRAFATPVPKRLTLRSDGDVIRVVGVIPLTALRGLFAGANPDDYRDRSDDA